MGQNGYIAFRVFLENLTSHNLLHTFPLDLVTEHFKGACATFWMHDTNTQQDFVLVNSFNRPDLLGSHGEISFLLSKSVLLNIMDRSEAKCFLELDIGHDSLSEWRTAPHRKYVVERFKKLLFIPLRDPEETIIAYLVLYSNEFKYSKNAQNDILHFQKVCGNVLHSLVSENQRLLRERRKIGHEIARQLANAGRRVDLFIETIKEKKSLRPNDALTFLMDIKGGLRTAQDTAGNETFREGVLRRVPVSSFIYLHEQYLSSSHLALSEYSRHRVELSTTTSIPFDTQVKVHRVDLDLLVSNLVSNAAKYSTPGGVIRTNWREVGNQYQLEVSNMSDPLSREELEKVTRFGVRGSNSGNVKGDGVGLAIVSDICGAYGITFEIFQTSGGVTWTHARVGIPKRMVRR